jgi:hypothetical protein
MALSLNHVPHRIKTFLITWRNLAPETVFAGITLEAFEQAMQPSLEVRAVIRSHMSSLAGLRGTRIQADAKAMAVMDLIVNAVKGTQELGDDSAFYQSLGYVPKSKRKSGLTRKKAPTPPSPDTPRS